MKSKYLYNAPARLSFRHILKLRSDLIPGKIGLQRKVGRREFLIVRRRKLVIGGTLVTINSWTWTESWSWVRRRRLENLRLLIWKVKRRSQDRIGWPEGQDYIIGCVGNRLIEAIVVIDLRLLCCVIVVIVRDHIVVNVVIGKLSLCPRSFSSWISVVSMIQASVIVIRVQ